MYKSTFPNARSGDLLFTCETGLARWFSVQVQDRVDPLARASAIKFTHVALALNDWLAIEAVPEPTTEHHAASDTKLAKFVARRLAAIDAKKNLGQTAWSDAELTFGVRPIPIADILIGAQKEGYGLAVLRNERVDAPAELLASDSKVLLHLFGSEYSVKVLRDSMEAALARGDMQIDKFLPMWPKLLMKLKGLAPLWTSSKSDPRSSTGLDGEALRRLAAHNDTGIHETEARPFFCSQLVPMLLTKLNFLPAKAVDLDITPTGLYQYLITHDWSDVTGIDYSGNAIQAMASDTWARSETAIQFINYRRNLIWRRELMGAALLTAAIQQGVNDMNASTGKALDWLDKFWPATSPIPAAESQSNPSNKQRSS